MVLCFFNLLCSFTFYHFQRGLFHPHGGRMYPVPMQLRSPAAPYESAPVLEDYIDDAGTLPISEIARARANRNSPPKENEYGGPVQRQITPTQVWDVVSMFFVTVLYSFLSICYVFGFLI